MKPVRLRFLFAVVLAGGLSAWLMGERIEKSTRSVVVVLSDLSVSQTQFHQTRLRAPPKPKVVPKRIKVRCSIPGGRFDLAVATRLEGYRGPEFVEDTTLTSVAITSEGDPLVVYFRNKRLGVTPLHTALPPGPVRLWVRSKGGRPIGSVDIEVGSRLDNRCVIPAIES